MRALLFSLVCALLGGLPLPADAAAPAPLARAAPPAPAKAPEASWERVPPTLLENQFLTAELALAAKPQFYVVFDLAGEKVLLKARGKTFRSWDIRSISFWGTGVPLAPLTLERRTTLFKPQRVTLNPIPADQAAAGSATVEESTTPDTFEIEALELPDMPTSYALGLSEGVRLTVIPTAEGFLARSRRLAHALWWNASLPVRALWWTASGKPFVAVELVLEKEDARALYWAFPEGSKALIHQ